MVRVQRRAETAHGQGLDVWHTRHHSMRSAVLQLTPSLVTIVTVQQSASPRRGRSGLAAHLLVVEGLKHGRGRSAFMLPIQAT
jgi:hypothetical protein